MNIIEHGHPDRTWSSRHEVNKKINYKISKNSRTSHQNEVQNCWNIKNLWFLLLNYPRSVDKKRDKGRQLISAQLKLHNPLCNSEWNWPSFRAILIDQKTHNFVSILKRNEKKTTVEKKRLNKFPFQLQLFIFL